MIKIRKETPADYQSVETLTRAAFWNIYEPGCAEHYLVHVMRSHPDFISDLALVIEHDGKIIGNIMYTRAKLVDENRQVKSILTFGPISIAPAYQRQGYGRQLMDASFERAKALGFDTIVIFGDPDNYVGGGFKSCLRYDVSLPNGDYPAAMMVKTLRPDVLAGHQWHYQQSPVMAIDPDQARHFDDQLPKLTKKVLPSQEAFYIISHAHLHKDA